MDIGYVHRIEQWELLPGAIDAMKRISDAGFDIVIVTNQSGIGRRLFTWDDMMRLHDHMRTQLVEVGINVRGPYVCPHVPSDHCRCRKPNVGLAELAIEQCGPYDLTKSWTIGDKLSDVEMGERLGTRNILLASRYWSQSGERLTAADLADAATRLFGESQE